MKRLAFIVALLTLAGADRPPPVPTPVPPPPPAPAMRQPSVWQQIQPSVNRVTGRIVDEPTYQLYQIQRYQDQQLSSNPAQVEADRFREERERQLRIEQSNTSRQNESLREQIQAARQIQLGRTTTTLDPSPIAAQAMADEIAISKLRNTRDKQLTAANEQRLNALKQRPDDRSQVDADYQKQVDEIERKFQAGRDAILGYGPSPTTQP